LEGSPWARKVSGRLRRVVIGLERGECSMRRRWAAARSSSRQRRRELAALFRSGGPQSACAWRACLSPRGDRRRLGGAAADFGSNATSSARSRYRRRNEALRLVGSGAATPICKWTFEIYSQHSSRISYVIGSSTMKGKEKERIYRRSIADRVAAPLPPARASIAPPVPRARARCRLLPSAAAPPRRRLSPERKAGSPSAADWGPRRTTPPTPRPALRASCAGRRQRRRIEHRGLEPDHYTPCRPLTFRAHGTSLATRRAPACRQS